MPAARALMKEETFARGEYNARTKVQRCRSYRPLGAGGPSTWAAARRTRSSPGYHITGIQP